MNFKQWLLENDNIPEDRISPDDLWDKHSLYESKDGCTFIYTTDGKLYTGKREYTHGTIRNDEPELYDISRTECLFGRCGEVYLDEPCFVIAFWNKDLQELIDPCIKALQEKGFVPRMKVIVSTYCGNKLLAQKPTPWQGRKISPEEWEKYRALHLARGKEKQQLMQDLGVGGQKIRPDAEKRWPLRSESFTNKFPKIN